MTVTTNGKTSAQWWQETKSDPEKLIDWLKDQYIGEMGAADRISEFIVPGIDEEFAFTIQTIIEQEIQHGEWVGELLENRGVNTEPLLEAEHNDRYWKTVAEEFLGDDAYYACAVAAHAEEMRLERILVIANDAETPKDIRSVFGRILIDEMSHARAFRKIAGDKYYNQASKKHARGREAIGLII